MNKKQLEELIYELSIKMEKYEEESRRLRDEMYLAEGSAGELQLVIWKLENRLKK